MRRCGGYCLEVGCGAHEASLCRGQIADKERAFVGGAGRGGSGKTHEGLLIETCQSRRAVQD